MISPVRLWTSEKVASSDHVSYPTHIGSRSKRKRKAGLDGMHDEYPLTSMDGMTNTTLIGGDREGSMRTKGDTDSQISLERQLQGPGITPKPAQGHGWINVQTEYSVKEQRVDAAS